MTRIAPPGSRPPEVGVIAGDRPCQPLLPAAGINAHVGLAQDTDGTAQLASARGDALWLSAADTLTVRAGHTFLAARAEVIRQADRFLTYGRFASDTGRGVRLCRIKDEATT